MERKHLMLEMEMELHGKPYDACDEIMNNASQYCDSLWIDGKLIDLSQDDSGPSARLNKSKRFHHYKYQLKPGIDYIPKDAFSGRYDREILKIILPEGLKKLQNGCFRSCHFKGDLILPDSLERICGDVFTSCKIDGTFHLPSTVKHVGSLPKSEETKDEIILPEGMVSYTPDNIITNHLHIPSTMRECRNRWGSFHKIDNNEPTLVTIAPNNPFLAFKDGHFIDLQKGKRNKLRELEKLKKKYYLESVLNSAGLTFSFWYNGYEIRIPIDNTHKLFFPRRTWDTKGGAEIVKNIALRLKRLFEENPSLSSMLSIDWEFNRQLNKEELFQKELKSSLRLCLGIDGRSHVFSSNLSNMGFSIVDELKQFSQKIIDTIEDLRKEYGPFYMELV